MNGEVLPARVRDTDCLNAEVSVVILNGVSTVNFKR